MEILKVTIDTNLLIYLLDEDSNNANFKKSAILFKTIIEAQTSLDIKITTRVESDLEQDKDVQRRVKIIKRVQNIFSCVGSGATDDGLLDELRKILFPTLNKSDKHYQNKLNDILHLTKHILNQRNVFVTNDKNFIKKKESINNAFNIQVMSSEEFVTYIESLNDTQNFQYKNHPKRQDYYSKGLSGVVEFDFTNNDHVYTIGAGDFLFETRWSSRGNDSMYIYNDPTSIEKLAIVENETRFRNVKEEYKYDFTSRAREPRKDKDIIILKNTKGYYAALKILDVKNKDTGFKKNLLKFKYVIETNGCCSFK